MRTVAAMLALLVLAVPVLAEETAAQRERRELEEDICYEANIREQRRYEFRQEVQRNPGVHESPQESRARGDRDALIGHRIAQLCDRYRERYGEERPKCCPRPIEETVAEAEKAATVKEERAKRVGPARKEMWAQLWTTWPTPHPDLERLCREYRDKAGESYGKPCPP